MPELIRLGVDATNPRDNLRSLESLASTGDNALRKLAACGQSCWLDNLSRQMMTDGELSHLVALGVRGVTANPATVAKAIATARIPTRRPPRPAAPRPRFMRRW